jgi:indole-3-glycerol phosphate synthase
MEMVHKIANPKGIPIIRKEFIFDSYQIYESRAHGADAILLITAILTPKTLRDLREVSEKLRMQCLVEVHDQEELRIALDAGSEILGINNRDLRTFKTNLETTEKLAPLIPSGKLLISESGITNRQHIQRIKKTGAHAVLVGEALITAPNVADKLKELS